MKTIDYILIASGKADRSSVAPGISEYTPWKSDTATPREEIRRLALHKFLRESGFTAPRTTIADRITLTVYHYRKGDPCHANGAPIAVTATTYEISKS